MLQEVDELAPDTLSLELLLPLTDHDDLDPTATSIFSPVDPELLPFTNTVFFDTNLGRFLDQLEDVGGIEDLDPDSTDVGTAVAGPEDFLTGENISHLGYSDFDDFPSPSPLSPITAVSPTPSTSATSTMSSSVPLSTFIGAFDTPSSQPSSSASPEGDQELQSRLAADEDKRRRNTAASARFRIKKKQRDQELERRAKETQEKVGELEKKISQLELENKWLRNLLVEKKS